MLSPSFMPNLTCHTTPSILKPPPSADTVSWKTLDSTFSPSDQTYYTLVSGEQSYFLSFHWSHLPQTTYISWPTNKFVDHAVPPPLDLSSPDIIPAFPLLCSGNKHCEETFPASLLQWPTLFSWFISKLSLSDCLYADHTHLFLLKTLFSSIHVYLVLCTDTQSILRSCKATEHFLSCALLLSLSINF